MIAYSALLGLLLTAIASCQQWDDRQSQQLQPIRLSKEIPDVIIEEYETSVINLIDYVSGSLINYQYDIHLVDDSSDVHNVLDIMRVAYKSIKILPQVEYFSFQYLPNSDLSGPYETFTRSTLLLDNGQGVLKMYLIDRSFNFVSYSFENYLQNIISNRNQKRLDNSTIQGGACSDLKHVQMNDTNQFLIAFCLKSEKVQAEEQQARKTYMTIIQIRHFSGPDPVILYYTQDYDRFPIDFTSPVRFVANFTNVTTEENNQTTEGFYGLFLLQMQNEPEFLKNFPRFCWMNFSIFEDMYQQGNYIKFANENDQNLMIRASSLYLKNHVNDARLIDFKTIFKQQSYTGYLTNSTTLNLAIVLEAQGMMLCYIDNYKEIIYRNRTVWCNDSYNAYIEEDSSALSIFYEPSNPDQRLYLISASPPKVFEFDISDFRNTVLARIYVTQPGVSRRFVALPQMAANKNQILLLMRDIFTGQNVIRIYSRNTTFFRIVQNDIYLPVLSRSGNFFFPNYYFNKFIFRDEMTVNITQSNSNKLVFDRSEIMLKTLQDSNLINGHTFNITLFHKNLPYQDGGNELVYITDLFVTFVDKYNLDIFQTAEGQIQQAGGLLNLFYSCGDYNFNYNIDFLYNGPEYTVQIIHQNESHTDLFMFSQAREELQSMNPFNSSNCTQSYLVPQSLSRTQALSKKMLLVCLSYDPAHLTSYSFDSDQEQIDLSTKGIQKKIDMPSEKILMNNYDYANRILMVIVSFDDNIMIDQDGQQLEVHYIETSETMNWRGKHGLNCTKFNRRSNGSNENLIDIFAYSSAFQQGLIIQNNNITLANGSLLNNASILVFQVDYMNYHFFGETFYGNLTVNGNIVRAQITTENLFLCLTDKGYIYIMQIFSDIIKPVGVRYSLNDSRSIIDFDIYDLYFLVLYHNDSVTEVYTLNDNIETSFRMRLPLYKKFENYVYKQFSDRNHPNNERLTPKRDFFENSLAIFMIDPESKDVVYMIYKLNEPQHNALFITNDSLSEVIKDANHTWIMLTGDREELNVHYMGVVTDNSFSLFLIKYYDQIQVNQNNNKKLIEICKNFNEGLTLNGYYTDSRNIQQIQIFPFTDLGIGSTSVVNPKGNITLSIQSTNNGVVIVPRIGNNNLIQFTDQMNDNRLDKYEALDISLMVGNYLQGYNMKFNAKCSFVDQFGKQQDCTKSLKLSTLTQSYNFPISFATSSTKVLFGFPIDRLIMMIDNTGFLRIQKIQDNYNLTNSRQEPLENILELRQLDVLGCLINSDSQFAKVQWINHTSIQKAGKQEYNDREIFLFFYQCYDARDLFRKLKAIEIAVFKEGFCPPEINKQSDSCFVYTRINDGIEIQYDMIDLALGNLTFALPPNFSFKEREALNVSSHLSYTSDLAIVCGISTSYSNLLLIYDFNITGINAETMNKTIVNQTLVKYNSASKLIFDTFKVNSVVPVPNSKFIVAAIDGFGAIFYHTGINQIVYKINITQSDPIFGLYDSQAYGDIKIFIITFSYPYNIIVMTNIGSIVYAMDIPISEETLILGNPELYTPKIFRVQRFPYQIADIQEVTTPQGFTLLIKSPMGRGLYQTLLSVISFYQTSQSKIFKTIVVDESGLPENLNCTSFMRNKKLETSNEDQVGISMLCNQKLRAARFSLRPSMNLTFSEYIQNGQNTKDGILSFNNFSIKLQAENDFTQGDVNNASVNLIINYSLIPKQRFGILTFVIVALLVFLSMILFLFVRSRELKYESHQEKLKKQAQFEQDEYLKNRSMFLSRKKYESSFYRTEDTKETVRVDLSQGNDDNSLKQRQSKRISSKRESRQSENFGITQTFVSFKKQDTDQSFKVVPNTFNHLFKDSRGSSSKLIDKINSAQFGQPVEVEIHNQVHQSHNIQDAELTNQTFEDESFVSLNLR